MQDALEAPNKQILPLQHRKCNWILPIERTEETQAGSLYGPGLFHANIHPERGKKMGTFLELDVPRLSAAERLRPTTPFTRYTGEGDVHGGFAAVNRGADFVKHLVPALRARTRCLTGHHAPHKQASLACTAHGAGQHRD